MPYDPHRAEASILLADRHVGTMYYHGRETRFEYTDLDPRHPILGQSFETDPTRRRRARNGLPTWFANLLPEPGSGLRLLLEADMGEQRVHDFRLLVHIGADLPGAVRVVPGEGCELVPADDDEPRRAQTSATGGLRFSLAGVQRKLSMVRQGRSLTLRAHGQDGHVLVKFQDGELDQVPQNEFAMMQWAAASGLSCASTELKSRSDLEGLPEGLWASSETVLAVDRFDRGADGTRVHQEDFAQVWNVMPGQKYLEGDPYLSVRDDGNVRMGRLISQLCPPEDVIEFIRRLTSSVLMGNADMHLKNWSLVYPGDRRVRLSPAYDLLCVTVYQRFNDRLAFPIGGQWDAERIGIEAFRRFGDQIEADPDLIADAASETAHRMAESWPTVKSTHPVPDFLARHVDERLAKHPLLIG
ncbi:MAG: type II toxin-antitoxin system HipA family toxin [Actinocrinis sp.]